MKHQRWTEDEVKVLSDNYLNCTISELCSLLPSRNARQITQKAFTLKLSGNRWTPEEDQLLWSMVDYAEVHRLFPQKPRVAVSRRIAYLRTVRNRV